MASIDEILEKEVNEAFDVLEKAEKAHIEAAQAALVAKATYDRLKAAKAALDGEIVEKPAPAPEKPAEKPKKPQKDENNPLAHVKCVGCGTVGKMVEQMIRAPSGAPVRVTACTRCNNQVF